MLLFKICLAAQAHANSASSMQSFVKVHGEVGVVFLFFEDTWGVLCLNSQPQDELEVTSAARTRYLLIPSSISKLIVWCHEHVGLGTTLSTVLQNADANPVWLMTIDA